MKIAPAEEVGHENRTTTNLGQWHLIRVQLLLLDFLMAEAKVNTTTLHADPHNSAILKTLRVNCQGPDFVFQT